MLYIGHNDYILLKKRYLVTVDCHIFENLSWLGEIWKQLLSNEI